MFRAFGSVPETCRAAVGGLVIRKNTYFWQSGVFRWRHGDSTFICKKCIDACPVDAIVGSANMMHSIIDDLCTGCELCIEPCPVDCIEIVSVSNDEIKAPRDISQSAYDIKESLSNNKRSKIKNFSDINLNISSDINTQITNRAINKAKKLEDMQITITKSDLKSLHDFDESLIGDFIKDRSD